MDGQTTQMEVNTTVLKEPRGFIKILEFVMSIFAFATTSGFSSYFSYKILDAGVGCSLSENKVTYGYPFRLDELDVIGCYNTTRYSISGDFASQSQYFVATGVLSFLFSLAITIFYVLKEKMYETIPIVPMADFWLTVVMAIFWLTSSSAWAQGLADLKIFTNPKSFHIYLCPKVACVDPLFEGNFATLNVSVLLGFLNFFLWAANLWFIYKETTWFLNRTQGPIQPGQPPVMK
uniref:MARVEL domain-containing protein n=1 Tax=Strigamia maritima TaxID=126957 RepID=T1IT37_STRMM